MQYHGQRMREVAAPGDELRRRGVGSDACQDAVVSLISTLQYNCCAGAAKLKWTAQLS